MPATAKIVWTAEEDEHLIKLHLMGYSNNRIAESVGRPRSTVGNRMRKVIADLSPEQRAEMGNPMPTPSVPPPMLRAEVISHRAAGWTDAMDAQITALRNSGMSYRKIGLAVGRHETTVWDRLMKLPEEASEAPTRPAEPPAKAKYGSGRADFFRRPDGPPPDKPDSSPNPRDPAWRRCLGDNCGRVFWSPSAAVRRCTKCKSMYSRCDGHGDGSRVDDRSELCLHL